MGWVHGTEEGTRAKGQGGPGAGGASVPLQCVLCTVSLDETLRCLMCAKEDGWTGAWNCNVIAF